MIFILPNNKLLQTGGNKMAVIGAILGDIAGSIYEFYRPKDLDWEHCELFTKQNFYTDDTILTLACKLAILKDIPFSETYTT